LTNKWKNVQDYEIICFFLSSMHNYYSRTVFILQPYFSELAEKIPFGIFLERAAYAAAVIFPKNRPGRENRRFQGCFFPVYTEGRH